MSIQKPFLSLYPLSDDKEPAVDYLITGVLPKVGLVVLLGLYGTGKTQLAMRMASSVATYGQFGYGVAPIEPLDIAPYFSTVNGYTLYFAGEGKAHIQSRVQASKEALSKLEQEGLHRQYGGLMPIFPVRVNTPLVGAHLEEIEGIISEIRGTYPFMPLRPALMVFDTLSASYFFKDENSNGEMNGVVSTLQAYAEQYQCCVVVIAHPPKSNDATKGYSRGASSLANAADVIIEIQEINNSPHRKVKIIKMRDGQYEGTEFKFKIENFGEAPALIPIEHSLAKNTPRKEKRISERKQKILELLKAIPDAWEKQSELVKKVISELPGEKRKGIKRMVSRDIEELEDTGHVARQKEGRYVLVKLAPTEYSIE